MIRNYKTKGKSYQLLPTGIGDFPGANYFTVIVGKNGTGKSRMLQGIVLDLLRDRVASDLFDREVRFGSLDSRRRAVEATGTPRRIICVSTSPFDKFPLLRRGETTPYYSYMGLRGLPSQNLSVSYMSRIMAALIGASIHESQRSTVVADVLHYLGYEGVIHCTFGPSLSQRLQDQLLSFGKDDKHIAEILSQPMGFLSPDGGFAVRQIRESSPDQIRHSLQLLKAAQQQTKKPRIEVYLDGSGVHVSSDITSDDVLMLIRGGMLRLREVSLRKSASGTFRMSEASSGEQSVVMALLAIASQIEDDCLVCIDEPEVCLHPEWQERYVHLLLNVFQDRRGCQFLIATHSPQIVAELPQANCFVTNMETGTVIESREVSHRSIDFQLASVFSTPGRRNEYLSRIALNTFSKASKARAFDSTDQKHMTLLSDLYASIGKDDPLRSLIETLREMQSSYGRHS